MGIRVVKMAVAVFISIAAAQALELNYALGAGLIAVLGIDITLRKSLQMVLVRIAASITGLVLASALFWVLGIHLWTISLFVLLVYPLLARFRMGDGIVLSSVLVFHIVEMQAVTVNAIINEIILLLIGLGTASIINLLYLPKADSKLVTLKATVEQLFIAIFHHMSEHLRDPQTVWDGQELLQAPEQIRHGLELAQRAAENRLFQNTDQWTPYFRMRSQHFDSIQRMVDLLAQVYQSLPQGEAVAELFIGLSDGVRSEYYAADVEASLLQLEQEFKNMPLPASREEFEMRSALLQLCLELKTYLSMSKIAKKAAKPEFVPDSQK